MTPRVAAILDMRLSKSAGGRWVFPAATKSGHVEPSSLKKQHLNAIADATRILKKHTVSEEAKFEGFEFYRLRHTLSYAVGTAHGPVDARLPRWPPRYEYQRYVHPQEQTIRGHSIGDKRERVNQEVR